jgi:phosphoribosylformimino-5-aminoimidazole carboxamide ribotide isomerase
VLKRYHDTAIDATFDLLPAIDLRGGRVVRLRQGDFDQETSYGDDPIAVAELFADAGATWLHIVDLDGAREGRPIQAEAIRSIVDRVGERVRCEVAGGLRTGGSVEAALATGATRAVVGTAALRDAGFAEDLVARHGSNRIAAAIDVRDGLALGDGWQPGAAGLSAEEAIHRLADVGVTTFEVTAIDRDGLLRGPDLGLLARIVELRRGAIIASGGVGRMEDLLELRRIGCRGAIVGRALYEGRFTVPEAIARLMA